MQERLEEKAMENIVLDVAEKKQKKIIVIALLQLATKRPKAKYRPNRVTAGFCIIMEVDNSDSHLAFLAQMQLHARLVAG
ncbi:unnamed protein product [Schistocephalus solidus]|uniref:Uncharacterized protein n=1 Tax=Schistocephalus solidus TaxID=70667 RepID=A0A183T8T7_SCHSO|nr:unnamed protein product [Schistocephalus solidus]